jgi:non-ribosomal peptide synthetase component F
MAQAETGGGPVDDATGAAGDAAQTPRYTNLPASVVAALDDVVKRTPDAEAVVEVDGERLIYQQLWDRGSAVAGGLRLMVPRGRHAP